MKNILYRLLRFDYETRNDDDFRLTRLPAGRQVAFTPRNDDEGFTFIEILVVITIIGVIYASAIVTFTSITVRSRDTRRKADLESVRQSLEMCRSLTGQYPDTIYDEISCSISGPILLKSTPHDPKPCSDLVGAYSYVKASAAEYTLSAPCMEVDTTYQVTNP